jgi:hypothetical protein
MMTKQEQQMLARTKLVCNTPHFVSHTYFSNQDTKETGVDILFAVNSPHSGLLTCTTLGLLNYDIRFKNGEKDIRIELVGVSSVDPKNEKDADIIARILSTAAFGIMEKHIPCGFGTVFPQILTGYLPNSDMKHLLFISPPSFWKEQFGTIELEDFALTWLYAVPISDAEWGYLRKKGASNIVEGVKALLKLMSENKADMFNLNRKSVEIPADDSDEKVSE